jgi:Seven times multi-haem cytochrome CxxCH
MAGDNTKWWARPPVWIELFVLFQAQEQLLNLDAAPKILTTRDMFARLPSTCAQCHMGPDHSQIEIYEESRHGCAHLRHLPHERH